MITTTATVYDHAAALDDLRRRHRRARQYADEAKAVGDTRMLHKALVKYYMRALQIEHAEAAPEGWECPRCLWGEARWPGLFLKLKVLHNCIPHWEDIALERARVLLAEQLEQLGQLEHLDGVAPPSGRLPGDIYRVETSGEAATRSQAGVRERATRSERTAG